MKGRVLAALGLCALVFAVLAPVPEALGASQVIQGKITEAIPCTNPSGFVISVASSTEKYISKTGITTSLPPNATPTVGQNAFVTIGATTTCETRLGSTVTTVTGSLIAYLSLPGLNTTPPPPPGGTGGGQTGGGSSGSSIADRIQSIFQSIFGGGQGSAGGNTNVNVSVSVQTGGSSSGSSGGVSPTNLGGMITVMLPCDPAQSFPTGTLFQVTVVGPLGGNYAYGPYTKDYQCGPLTPGKNIVGSYTPGAVCDLCLGPQTYCPSPQLGWINRMPGDGNSGCANEKPSCAPGAAQPTSSTSGEYCTQFDQQTRDAIRKYGGNLMSGNVPGLRDYCPNYDNLTTQQKEDFWVRAAGGIMKAETNCNPNVRFDPDGENSNGLFQLTPGNSASGHPGACPLTSTNIFNPQININCGVAIMDSLSRGGLSTAGVCDVPKNQRSYKGLDRYWSTMRSGACQTKHNQESSSNVLNNMKNFPGCSGGSGGSGDATRGGCRGDRCGPPPPPTSGDCAQGPVAPTGQCPQQGQTITAQNKAQMELNVRQALSQCKCTNASCASNTRGISVTSSQTSGGACGYKQDGVAGGCTDVSGLTCGSMSELCSLANACGGFTIGGGSECGHSGDCSNGMHGSGNAVDINHSASLDSCIKSRFQQIQCPRSITRSNTDQCWKNPATGAIYWAEPAVGRQGAHWHTCFNGYCR